jgi:hypothetical protein
VTNKLARAVDEQSVPQQPLSQAPSGLEAYLDRWVAKGFVTAEQVDLIRADAAGMDAADPSKDRRSTPRTPTAFATEALAYVGGAMIVIAALVITAIRWEQLPLAVRLALPCCAAIALFVSGKVFGAPASATRARLQGVLWLLSTMAVASFLAVAAAQQARWDESEVALVTTFGTAAYAAVMWRWHRYPLQHAAFFVACATAAGAAAAVVSDGEAATVGMALWGVGASWIALTWGGLVPPSWMGRALGALAALLGSLLAMTDDWGHALALATVVGIVGLAVVFHDLLLLGIGAFGALLTLPRIMERFFPGSLAPPLALLVAGVALVLIALLVAGRQQGGTRSRARAVAAGTPRSASVLAVGIALLATAAVIGMTLT